MPVGQERASWGGCHRRRLRGVCSFAFYNTPLRLAIARALVKIDANDKKALKDAGFMTRDSRAVERKKPGQPKARRRFQFSKR